MKFRVLLSVASLLAAGAFVAQAQALELVQNGSFEAPDLPGSAYAYPGGPVHDGGYADPTQDHWTYVGAAVVATDGYSDWYGNVPPAGQDGGQFAALQTLGSVSQTFTLPNLAAFSSPFARIDISWLAAGRPDIGSSNGNQSYKVLLNGTSIGTYSTTSGQAFTLQRGTLHNLTPGADYTLSFVGLKAYVDPATDDSTAFIDRVSATAVVPEPASWALMIMGFGAAGAMLRRRDGGTYRLVETTPDGRKVEEDFRGPDHQSALARAKAVAEGSFEIWHGQERLCG